MDSSEINLIWQEKLARARWAGAFLARRVPTLQAIALTGSVAYGDVSPDDDLDFLVICQAGRVYTTRLFAYAWALLLGKKRSRRGSERDKWCLNIFLDERDLRVPARKQSEFARLQVARLLVLQDKDGLFREFLRVNRDWLGESAIAACCARHGWTLAAVDSPRYESVIIGRTLGDVFEVWTRRVQQRWMRDKITREYVSDTQLFFHPLERQKAARRPPTDTREATSAAAQSRS